MRPGPILLVGAFAALISAAVPMPAHARQQAQGPPLITVDSVAVVGNDRAQTQGILALFGVEPGSEISQRDVQRGVKALYQSGQFSDVVVRSVGTGPYVLIVEVEEEPRVRRVVISGLEHLSPGDVRDTASLTPGSPLNPQRILDAKTFIRSELAADGIPFANIEDRVQPVGGSDSEVDLFLDVTEGQRVTIADISFVGNQGISDEELRGHMGVTREGFWWFQPGSYNQVDYRVDLDENIPAAYRSKGFLDARVVSDTLIIDPTSGKARIEVTVDEGPQYRLRSFQVQGNSTFDDETLEGYFRTRSGGILQSLGLGGGRAENGEGEVFDYEAFNEARQQAASRYGNEGYLYAQITPVVTRVRGEDGTPMVDAVWDVVEGPQAIVRRVSIVGNDYTHEWVIRNQLSLIPGDVYSQDRLVQSWQAISALGFFEVPLPQPQMNPTEDGDVDVTFEVVEKSTGSVSFGTSVGGGYGLSGFIGYEQPNLFGQAKSGTLRWDFGRYINSFELAYSDPALFRSLVSGRIRLFNSQDRFFQFSSGRRRRIGGDLRFGIPWRNSLYTRVFVGYGLSRTSYELFSDVDDTSLFGREPGVQSTLTFSVTRQTTNHPIFPTSGSRQNLDLELNGGPLGGDGKFTKVLADGSWWVPVGQLGGEEGQGGLRLALGLTLRGGMVFGDVEAFPFDRFWMGGVQFGQQLRGYGETSVTPFGYFPERSSSISDIDRLGNAFFSMTAEYAVRVGSQLSLSAFYDAGNIWRHPADYDPTQLLRGAGLGIQLVTPFGPIGLDYAYGFDKPQPGWQFHFRMGAY